MSDPWKSRSARALVEFYLERKPGVLSGQLGLEKLNREPRFVAGMLLRTYGGGALEAFEQAKRLLGADWPDGTEALLREALKAELHAVHGTVHCCFCHRPSTADEDLNDWLRSYQTERWACPSCAAEATIQAGDEVEPSN